jgi:hypothetical protein
MARWDEARPMARALRSPPLAYLVDLSQAGSLALH